MVANLDYKAVKIAQEIIKQAQDNDKEFKITDVETLITKTLGVLQENGVYACMLYLFSRSKKSEKMISEIVQEKLFDEEILGILNSSVPFDGKNGAQKKLEFLSGEICSRLDTILFVKRLWEQILIYARYGAKAGGI